MKKVVIVDYGMGNLDSVARAIEECGGSPHITERSSVLETADYIILPGVGAFSEGMRNIQARRLDESLRKQVVNKGVPCLGICLGMQLLATKGFEGGEKEGLGFIEGEVRRLESVEPTVRIPHIGWNEVHFIQESPLFKGLSSGKDFYFVHSYNFICKNKINILGVTPYCDNFVSVVGKGNIFGVQFHPEKSQQVGFEIFRNFLNFYR